MKKMLTAAGLLLAMSLAIPAASYAAAGQGCRHHGQHGMHRMFQQLNLSDKQQDQLKQLHRQTRDKMLTIHDAMQDNREALMKLDPQDKGYMSKVDTLAAKKGKLVERMVKLFAKQRAECYDILTPEQRSKLSQMRKQHHDRWNHDGGQRGGQGMGRGPGGPGMGGPGGMSM